MKIDKVFVAFIKCDGKDSNIKYLRYEYPNLSSIPKKKVLELAYKVSKNNEI